MIYFLFFLNSMIILFAIANNGLRWNIERAWTIFQVALVAIFHYSSVSGNGGFCNIVFLVYGYDIVFKQLFVALHRIVKYIRSHKLGVAWLIKLNWCNLSYFYRTRAECISLPHSWMPREPCQCKRSGLWFHYFLARRRWENRLL